MPIKFYPFILIPLILFNCGSSEQNAIELQEEKLNHILDSYVKSGVYPFLYARVEGESGTVYEHAVTNEDLFGNLKIDGDTWIRIWSMSKLVTISVAMDLIEENKLSLSDPVIKYIPEFKDLKVAVDKSGKSISQLTEVDNDCPHTLVDMDSIMLVKHLFNHTAGFYYTYTLSNCLNNRLSSLDIPTLYDGNELIEKLATIPLVQQPGESYHYGLNIAVLGLVIERITGKNLAEVFENRVIKKLGLTGLQYAIPNGVTLIPAFTGRNGYLETAKKGDLPILGQYVPNYDSNQELFLGGVGMLGTAKGYIDYWRKLLDPDKSFLSEESISKMTSRPLDFPKDRGYQTGFGSYITGKGDHQKDLLTVGGYEFTKAWVDRENKLFGVLFSQVHSTTDGDGLGSQMEQEFYKELYSQLNNSKH
ncbi:MAG: serine hydrolase domain-containing protein [Candidatus Neomarinimicrobiota bacterium]